MPKILVLISHENESQTNGQPEFGFKLDEGLRTADTLPAHSKGPHRPLHHHHNVLTAFLTECTNHYNSFVPWKGKDSKDSD